MRLHVLAPSALLLLASVLPAHAGGSAQESCLSAGFRMGGPGFDICVARAEAAKDPLEALEAGGGALDMHADGKGRAAETGTLAKVIPVRSPLAGASVSAEAAHAELPPSFGSNAAPPPAPVASSPASPAAPPPASTTGWMPAMPTMPGWMTGAQ